jgi:hypothetical protein
MARKVRLEITLTVVVDRDVFQQVQPLDESRLLVASEQLVADTTLREAVDRVHGLVYVDTVEVEAFDHQAADGPADPPDAIRVGEGQ